jgi:NTP pyrophosphatase (non-canonical NTP hydrolase)
MTQGTFWPDVTAPVVDFAGFEKHVAGTWRGIDLRTAYAIAGAQGPVDPKVIEAIRAIAVLAVGVVGEAGEVADEFKKYLRGDKLDRHNIALELGDLLYYLTAAANVIGYSLDDVARLNIQKLAKKGAA